MPTESWLVTPSARHEETAAIAAGAQPSTEVSVRYQGPETPLPRSPHPPLPSTPTASPRWRQPAESGRRPSPSRERFGRDESSVPSFPPGGRPSRNPGGLLPATARGVRGAPTPAGTSVARAPRPAPSRDQRWPTLLRPFPANRAPHGRQRSTSALLSRRNGKESSAFLCRDHARERRAMCRRSPSYQRIGGLIAAPAPWSIFVVQNP